jgi:peptidoglycan/xylan/chitin deacetylase (PgdA/CDA1 family)
MRLARGQEAFLLTIALAGVAFVAPITASAQSETVVSLTFDDGWADQYETRSTLGAHGIKGTYYVNTGRTGTSGFLSWAELVALDADGHEVTGHTLDHVNLVAATATEARRQVCDDRQNLVSRGFVARSFAYPFGEYDATVKSIVQECGYASGRGAFGLRNITSTTDTRPFAGRIPPPDRYAILTPCCIRSDVTLAQLQSYIVKAEDNGGGWVPLVLHRICADCGGDDPAPSMTPATFKAFVDWLSQRSSSGTVVRTVGQVTSGDAQPATTSPRCDSSTCSAGWYARPVSVSLQVTDGGSGVAAVRYTLDGSEPTVSSPVYTGPFTVSQTTTVQFRSWDNGGNVEPAKSQLFRIDTAAPTVAMTAPTNGSTVKGTVKVTATAGDVGSGVLRVSFYANGVLIGSKSGGGTVFANWNTGKLRGQYTLTAVAEDVAGNATTSAPVTVTVR